MSLSADLRSLGAAVAPSDPLWGEPTEQEVKLCPRLRSCYSPRMSWHEEAEQQREKGSTERAWARVWDPAVPPEGLGSSLARNPKRPPRYGLRGLTTGGRRQVWRSLALLEEHRRLLSFWTITLPTDALIELARLGTWQTFQARIRQELGRQLRLAGLLPLVIGVVELQPQRSAATGMPCPHLHIVFKGRRSGASGWALSIHSLDSIICVALESAGVFSGSIVSAGNVQNVRRSVRAYLACYMTKKAVATEQWVAGQWEGLLPRQWWLWSERLRDWVKRHIFTIRHDLVVWVNHLKAELQAAGLIRYRVLDFDDPRIPLTIEVDWISCETFAHLLYLWQTDQWDVEWFRNYRLNRDSSQPRFDPQQHQHL